MNNTHPPKSRVGGMPRGSKKFRTAPHGKIKDFPRSRVGGKPKGSQKVSHGPPWENQRFSS